MLRIPHRAQTFGLGGLGQMPPSRTSGPVQIAFSPVIVQSQAECAQKSGELFDEARLCCIKKDLSAPGEASKLGWFCAYTAFGPPRAASFLDMFKNQGPAVPSYPGAPPVAPRYGPNPRPVQANVGADMGALGVAGVIATILYLSLRKPPKTSKTTRREGSRRE